MGFGPWDLARLVLGAGNVGRHLAKENRKNVRAGVAKKRHEDMVREEIQEKLDPKLEAQYREMISDPNRYNEVWDMLESRWYSLSLEDQAMYKRLCPECAFIDGGRKPFTKDISCTYDEVEQNKRNALICLMFYEDKCPEFYAETYVRRIYGK